MGETQKTIAIWANEVFGPAPSVARIAARANEEMAELLRHVTSGNADAYEIVVEAADVVIVLMRLAEVCRRDLMAEVEDKMAINRQRRWQKDGTGHGYHVRPAAGNAER